MGLGQDTLNNSGIVADNMITMFLWRSRMGHAVIAHVNVLWVLWLNLCSKVFDRYLGDILSVLVWSTTTSSIR